MRLLSSYFLYPKSRDRETGNVVYWLMTHTPLCSDLYFSCVFFPSKLMRLLNIRMRSSKQMYLDFIAALFALWSVPDWELRLETWSFAVSKREDISGATVDTAGISCVDVWTAFLRSAAPLSWAFVFLYTWKTLTIYAGFAVGIFINDWWSSLYKGSSASLTSLYQMVIRVYPAPGCEHLAIQVCLPEND